MRVVILGSGVVGVASAWYLNQAGHEVTVIDREPGAALETSAANAGQISPGYAAPWAAPGVPLKAIKWMFQRHAPLAVRLDGTQFQLKWMWQMLRNCDTSHYMENKGRMVRLAEYSRDCLKALRAETNIQYEGRQGGTLQLFRTEQQYENATRDIAVLEDAGVPYQLLESSRLAEVEPALAEVAHKLTGGLQLPNDETGDCQLFTQNLARMAEQAGVKFRFNTPVDQLLCDGEQIYGVKCGDEVIKADAYVMAFGSYSTAMLKGIVDIPVYPLKGYSLTIPIAQEDGAPVSTILDEVLSSDRCRYHRSCLTYRTAETVCSLFDFVVKNCYRRISLIRDCLLNLRTCQSLANFSRILCNSRFSATYSTSQRIVFSLRYFARYLISQLIDFSLNCCYLCCRICDSFVF